MPLTLAVLLATAPLAVSAAATVAFSELPDGGGFELSNGLVRSRWLPYGPAARTDARAPDEAASALLNQTYDIYSSKSGWATLADSGLGIQVAHKAFPDNATWSLRQKLAIPGLDHALPVPLVTSAAVTAATRFTVSGNDTASATVSFNLTLSPLWSVTVTLTLATGQHNIHERLSFLRLAASQNHMDEVRVRKIFHTAGLPEDLHLSFWRAVNYCGWAWPGASFVVQTLGSWSPRSGGGSFPDLVHWSGNKVHIGPAQTVAHQAPPAKNDQSERINWITLDDVPVGASYVLEVRFSIESLLS